MIKDFEGGHDDLRGQYRVRASDKHEMRFSGINNLRAHVDTEASEFISSRGRCSVFRARDY